MRALITVTPIIALVLSIAACQGDAGPAGEQGPPGPQGPAGAPALVDEATVASLIEQMQEQLDTSYTTAAVPPKSTPGDYTKFLVRDAISRYESEGLDATVAYYNTKESVDGQWYVFIIDQDGYTIAHHNPQFRGRDPSLRVDATGYFYGDDLLSATEAGHWVDYVLLNPESGENRQKHTWIVRHDGLLFGSGWYE